MAENKHFCMQCMLETDPSEAVCPYCAYASGSMQAKQYLPMGIVIRDRYLVGKMIKRNVDSAVYIGRDQNLDKIIEIREFFPDKVSVREDDMKNIVAAEGRNDLYEEYLQSFIQLWKNLMRFKGLPALLEVSDVFEQFGAAYAVTDHNESTTFRKILDTMNVESNPFSLNRIKTLILSILSTVESLHTANVIHRGISPESLVLSSDGTLKITGFAIAQVRTTKNKLISSVCDGYAAIEQYDFNWQQGSWTDIYSIGALIYKMLTGRTLPPAPSRLNDEEVFFTQEELQRIPSDMIDLVKGCLVLMPQGRMKDIHDIINVFSPQETSKKTVSVGRPNAARYEMRQKEVTQRMPTVRAANVIISENQKLREKQIEEESKPIEIVKPKQAEAVTKTTLQKAPVLSDEQKRKTLNDEEAQRKLREELYLKNREDQQKVRLEDEKRRREREELRLKKKEERRKNFENSVVGQAGIRVNGKAEKIKNAVKRHINREKNPAAIAVSVGLVVCVTCIFVSLLLYGTVLYKFVDAPVLDNCLSYVSFLPVNAQNIDNNSIEYVEVADFKMLTREYIENDALFNKRYNIVFEYDYCDTVEKGYVFSQSVSKGEKVPIASTITVYISKGIELIKFVDVSGMQYEEAEEKLSQIGFKVVKSEKYNIGIYKQDKVISASLVDGDEYPKGTEVTVVVWSAPPITLPSSTQSEQEQTSVDQSENEDQQADDTAPGDFFSFWRYILGL